VKKLINAPVDVVADALRGMAAAHPELRVDHENRIVYRRDAPVLGKVAVISGGGSGHEPLHVGFVGPGMLDAACPGEIFTSPVPHQILEATSNASGGAGALYIVTNYSGDVMNFEMAAELADATGQRVEAVVIGDDVAITDGSDTAGRRGVGGTVLLEKIVGAAADQGRCLSDVLAIAERVKASVRSMGLALTSCTVPAVGHPTFAVADHEIEIGIGVHGEPGKQRSSLRTARELAEMLVEPVLADLDFTGSEGTVVFVNGMGATPLIELYVMYNEVTAILERAGVGIARSLVGSYFTSLDMAGCSITLLKADDEFLRLWDHPVNTPALRKGC
jgi:dihydroxyacetone kinase-like protein